MKQERQNTAAKKYRWVQAWGNFMQSFQYYINDQANDAERDKAPLTAIYKGKDGKWRTTDDITEPSVLDALGLPQKTTITDERKTKKEKNADPS